MRTRLHKVRRVVIKVGSALITANGTHLAYETLACWAAQIARLHQQGLELVLVSSGSIAAGISRLGWAGRPREIHKLQAAAAVGQVELIRAYEESFAPHRIHTAQVLLTHQDLSDRKRYLNARSTLHSLIGLGVVPIINENDTTATTEIRFGDNDTLGALVANLIEADLLILLTDQDGLYSADPRHHPDAELIAHGCAEDSAYEEIAGGAGSTVGTGGMLTKVRAARRAARSGTHTLIANGREHDILPRLLAGEVLGTLLQASSTPLAARKQWLADHLQLAGELILDHGAVKALVNGKSLLPVGVTAVHGQFERGAAVACCDSAGQPVARGLVNYSATECRRIIRHPSTDITALLGYIDTEELIHRDNMVLTLP